VVITVVGAAGDGIVVPETAEFVEVVAAECAVLHHLVLGFRD